MQWGICSIMKKRAMSENDSKINHDDREIDIFKTITRFRKQSGQTIRMSLTLRIAAHYCGQLVRSYLRLLPWMILALTLFLGPHYYSVHKRILSSEPTDHGEYSQLVIQDAMVSAQLSNENMPEDVWGRIRFGFRYLFQKGHTMQACFSARQKTGMHETVMIYHDLKRELFCLAALLLVVAILDMRRMVYFLAHHDRLDKTLLQPIQDMTAMAANVSANNLSNRINVEGTKNELRDLAIVINSMLDRLEVSYESQKQFVSDASHELRTPIAVIQGYADMLARWGKDDPQVLQEGIDAISQEAANMKDLVQDLLFLARHDKKTLMMEMSQFDPVVLLSEIKKEAEMVSPQDTFLMQPAEHCELTADRNMIKQVMRILLDNAVKYTSPGGTITMGCAAGSEACILTMQDTGDGISPEDLPHIFDRFYRADKARKSEAGGHGLGLSIARIIVVAHGGRIRVRSKLGEGTLFTVEIPYETNQSGEKTIEESPAVKKTWRFKSRRRTRKGAESGEHTRAAEEKAHAEQVESSSGKQ